MNKTIENQIISNNNHQFIYGCDGKERKEFLHNIANNYPVVINENRPMAIYLNKIGLPNYSLYHSELDKIKLASFSAEYLNFSIAHEMIDSLLNNCDCDSIKDKVSIFLKFINELSTRETNISSLVELNELLKKAQNFYYENYCMYSKVGKHNNFLDELSIPFLDIDYFTKNFKEMLNNNLYFCVIADYQDFISLPSIQAINSLVASRINSNISMKVACDPSKWQTYYSLNGDLTQNIHDYNIIELDDSYSEHIKVKKY